jgi:hypothetical protein
MPTIKPITQENSEYISRHGGYLTYSAAWLQLQALQFDSEMKRQEELLEQSCKQITDIQSPPSRDEIMQMSKTEYAIHLAWAKQQKARIRRA